MGCYSGDAGMIARQEASFGSEIACYLSSRAQRLIKARLPGQRECLSADRFQEGIADLAGRIRTNIEVLRIRQTPGWRPTHTCFISRPDSGRLFYTGMYLCRDKIAGSDFGQRHRRWPEGRRAGCPTQLKDVRERRYTGMYLCRDKIAGSDFGQRHRRWPEGRRAGCPTQRQGCT